jgi:hypothetical protein
MWKIFIKACILFNYLNFKFFLSLNATFPFLDSLSYALRAEVNMTLPNISGWKRIGEILIWAQA